MKQVTLKQSAMNKQSGFTLIELVIVIIILGILSATAIPKFLDLQGDARASAMNGVKSALEGAATITYSKAAIAGVENTEASSVDDVTTYFGYPDATDLEDAAELSTDDWTISSSNAGSVNGVAYITAVDQTSGATSTCKVTYTNAQNSASRPTIAVDDSGC